MYGHPEFDLYEAIYTTRAMRRLKSDPVPSEIVMKIVEAATMSPSNSNRQPWIFVVVTNPETRRFVGERYRKWWEVYLTPERRTVTETRPDSPEARSLRSATWLANHVAEAPVLIFCCVRRYRDTLGGTASDGEYRVAAHRTGQPMFGSLYPAIQNLCLAARGYGLGTAITEIHRFFGDEIDALLGVPSEYANVTLIPMGYPKGNWGRPNRKPAAEVTYWERWGNRLT